jgi:DNA polymerase III alpha subunit
MGSKVLPPDVNESDAEYTPRGIDIRFGLAAIRNVGEGVVASIKAARESKGRFTSFGDFLAKVDAQVCNKKTIESLIKAGAFDSLGESRKGLMSIHLEAIDSVIESKRAEAIGVKDGDILRVSNSHGSISLPALVEDIHDDAVWVPRNSFGTQTLISLNAVHGDLVSVVKT